MSTRFSRRGLIGGTAAVAAASSFPKPALAQKRHDWTMVTSWPRGLPGLGTGAERLAKRLEHLSEGRIRVQYYADELVPPLQVFEAVSDGDAQIGHDAAYYHSGKTRAAPFFTAVPFGMTGMELNGWIYWGGGQELWDRAYAPFGLKPFLAGNTGTQMGGWFREEITGVEDFQGLKVRMPGQGGQVLQTLGATVVVLGGRSIFINLQNGSIDAAEWVGPYNDLALGFHQVAKYYYYPGFHEPGPGLECIVNQRAYDALSSELKAIVAAATAEENLLMYSEYVARSGPALKALVEEHGVKLRRFPRDVMVALGNASGDLVRSLMEDPDPITREVAQAFVKARAELMPVSTVNEYTLMRARRLDFDYPT